MAKRRIKGLAVLIKQVAKYSTHLNETIVLKIRSTTRQVLDLNSVANFLCTSKLET